MAGKVAHSSWQSTAQVVAGSKSQVVFMRIKIDLARVSCSERVVHRYISCLFGDCRVLLFINLNLQFFFQLSLQDQDVVFLSTIRTLHDIHSTNTLKFASRSWLTSEWRLLYHPSELCSRSWTQAPVLPLNIFKSIILRAQSLHVHFVQCKAGVCTWDLVHWFKSKRKFFLMQPDPPNINWCTRTTMHWLSSQLTSNRQRLWTFPSL